MAKPKALSAKAFMSNHSALISFIVLFVVAIIFTGSTFLQPNNLINVLRNNAVIGIISLGMTLIIITGGIDLAVGSQLAFIGVVVINTLVATQNILLAILAGLATALITGLATGLLVAKLRMPAFIVTLGTMSIYRSLSQFWMNGGGITTSGDAGKAYIAISNTNLFGVIPMPVIIWAVCVVLVYLFMKHTAPGRHIYAVGSGENAAKLAGVSTVKIKTMVYTISAVLVLIGTIVETSRLGSVNSASSGTGYELDAIAAAVIGGTAMQGGRGTITGTVLGTLTLGIIDNLMNLMGVNAFLVAAVKGAVIIIAVLITSMLNREKT